MLKCLILISCITLLFQTEDATRTLDPKASDLQKCAQYVPKVSKCWSDMRTHFGRPNAACCSSLWEIDGSCLATLFPENPYDAPFFIRSLCSTSGGSDGDRTIAIPFPFPSVGGGVGGLPSPSPPVRGGGGSGLPFSFPFPLPFAPLIGGGANSPPPKA